MVKVSIVANQHPTYSWILLVISPMFTFDYNRYALNLFVYRSSSTGFVIPCSKSVSATKTLRTISTIHHRLHWIWKNMNALARQKWPVWIPTLMINSCSNISNRTINRINISMAIRWVVAVSTTAVRIRSHPALRRWIATICMSSNQNRTTSTPDWWWTKRRRFIRTATA